ncbi:uncharacterized protein LOC126410380 [Nymphaea colorata]|uniref:DUF241 domain-containing protein n=1 Tax=Nymphaea colorata TaxID=210225 RepID=A0A5K1H402_9MAGN|nr:uncharacterized protein LOC126410380 [Nymphaea colorata]
MAVPKVNSSHTRTSSLPSSSHPTLGKVEDYLHLVKSWEVASPRSTTCGSFCSGFRNLIELFLCMDEFLQMPLSQQFLQQKESHVSQVMDDFLILLDVCGMVKDSLVQMREQLQGLSSLFRRRESSFHESIAFYRGIRRRMKKDMTKCLSLLKSMRSQTSAVRGDDHEVVGSILCDVKDSTVSTFELLVQMISGHKRSASVLSKLRSIGSRRCEKNEDEVGENEIERVDEALRALYACTSSEGERKNEVQIAERRMVDLELCLRETEAELDTMFRCLIKARVFLLNALTAC